MTTQKTETIIVYLDKYIINLIDSFQVKYINHPRGKLISSALAFYLSQESQTIETYMNKAISLIENTGELDKGVSYGTKRKGKVRVNLYLKPTLAKELRGNDKKIVIIASLIYVGLIQ